MKQRLLTGIFHVFFYIGLSFAQTAVTPQNALQQYLKKEDDTYRWIIHDTLSLGNETKVYRLLLTSQTWRNIVWTHQLSVIVPKNLKQSAALLFISGGSLDKGQPRWTDKQDALTANLSSLAEKNGACVALLKQTPNQPLFNGLTEDALISYTFHQFQKEGDYTWPLLFPMVKSAVKAMDAVTEFTEKHTMVPADRFVVSGLSKRGWTTWLTGASDQRVIAIAPMVIDVLNMPVSLDYQIETWKEYSVEIQDYVNLGIPQQAKSEAGATLLQMVDPYNYRHALKMPKMIFMGTNDPYWVVDNIKHYYDSIPGTNLLHYVPNVGHNLGDGQDAFNALNAFFALTLRDEGYPPAEWQINTEGKKVNLALKILPDKLQGIKVWEASSKDADLRNNVWLFSQKNYVGNEAQLHYSFDFPSAGYKAFFVELLYPDPTGSTYGQSSRIFVMDSLGLVESHQHGHLEATLKALAEPHRNKILVAAHRGVHHEVPENSLAAIEAAIKQGVDIVEIDVKVSSDGIPFLMHDQTIDRTTNGKGDAEGFTFQALSRLQLKHRGKQTSYHIPTLEEALQLAKGKIVLDLDLKTDKLDPILHTVAKVKAQREVIFFDSDYKQLAKVKAANSSLKLMPRSHDLKEADKALALFEPSIVHLDESFYTNTVTAHIKNKGANVWMNTLGDLDKMIAQQADLSELDKFLAKGANIIQTDEPEKLLRYLNGKEKR